MAQKTSLNSVAAGTPVWMGDCEAASVHLRTPDAGTGLTGNVEASNEDTPSAATDWIPVAGGSAINISTTPTLLALPHVKWVRLNLTAWTSGTAVATWFAKKQHQSVYRGM